MNEKNFTDSEMDTELSRRMNEIKGVHCARMKSSKMLKIFQDEFHWHECLNSRWYFYALLAHSPFILFVPRLQLYLICCVVFSFYYDYYF